MDTTTNDASIYAEYDADYAAIAQEQEDHIRAALAGTPALSLELDMALNDYRSGALSVLRAVTVHPSADLGADFATNFLTVRCRKEADVALSNAVTRVEKTNKFYDDIYRGELRRAIDRQSYIAAVQINSRSAPVPVPSEEANANG